MDTTELLKKVRKIEIKALGLSQNIFAGQYHSVFKGRGMAFSEVREYQYGDDGRDIDWNVTGRFHRSLDFGTAGQLKRECVTEIATTLAFSAIQNNDKIGVIFFSDHVEKYIPPKKGRKHILYLIREMLTFTPNSKRTDVGVGLEYLNKVVKRRCTAFVISDFYPRKDFSQELRITNRKHDVVAIQVYDPRAKVMPDVGLLKVIDAETGHEMYVDTHDIRVRKAHNTYWEEREQRLHDTLTQSHVDSVAIATNDDYVKMLITLFLKRRR